MNAEQEVEVVEEEEWLTPAERRKKEKDKKREENRRKFQMAKEQAAKGKMVVTARQPVGTKVGNKQRMQEFKDKLLTAHNGNNVISKVMQIALDDEHPGQMNALKLCLERMLPTSMFEDMRKQGERPNIQINISGIHDPHVVETGDVLEGEVLDGDS